jgi:hypothetical protein
MGTVTVVEETGVEGTSASAGGPKTGGDKNLPGEITEGVAIANVKSVAEQPATLANIFLGNLIQNTNQAQENAVSFQQTQNSVQATVLGKVVQMLTTLGPLESMSAQQILTGNSVAEELGALKAAVASLNTPT